MTIFSSSVEGMQKAQALLAYAANRIAETSATSGPVSDVVSLSDSAVALIEARVAMAVSARAFHAEDEIQKRLIDLVA